MKFHMRLPFNHHLFFIVFKKRWAYGVSSLIEESEKNFLESKHFLFFDFDTKRREAIDDVHRYLMRNRLLPYHFRFTRRGFHVVVPREFSATHVIHHHINCPHVDLRWSYMGLRREYWFLETKRSMPYDKRLRYMKIERKT